MRNLRVKDSGGRSSGAARSWLAVARRLAAGGGVPICRASPGTLRVLPDPTRPSATPDFLQHDRPPVPDIVVPRGVQPFHLHAKPVRGRLVRLGPLADALLTRRDNHPAVARLLGQALALTAGLAAALKFRGSFSVQAKGDGAVSMLLADCTDAGALRGYARVDAERFRAALEAAPEGGRGDGPDAGALLGQRLSRLFLRPGAGHRALPGHRRHRGRRTRGDGGPLLPHLRAAPHASPPRLRAHARRAGGRRR